MENFDPEAALADRDKILGEMGNMASSYENTIAALRSRIAELEKTGNELVQEFRSPYIGGIYSTSFEHKLERVGALIAELDALLANKVQS